MATKKSPSDKASKTEIRIGISDSTQELNIESTLTQDEVIAQVQAAMNKGEALSLLDVKGRQTLIPHNKIAFVEVGDAPERRVGFATL
jgi:Protein of unknown function (DUF3107)